mmetsp:Transcript_86859/g.202181  ORF Transcript_86859/g.202181 Transcript_86859/m.202181 type:complete len:205 (+) Transcript_86859:775-1389(+)
MGLGAAFLLAPKEDAEGRLQSASGRPAFDVIPELNALQLTGSAFCEALGQHQRRDVPGQGVVPTERHNSRARGSGLLVVLGDHLAHPVDLPCDVAVVHAGCRTRGNELAPIPPKRPCKCDHNLRLADHLLQRGSVAGICHHDIGDVLALVLDDPELLHGAPRNGPLKAVAVLLRQVQGGKPPCEASGSVDQDFVHDHGSIAPTA